MVILLTGRCNPASDEQEGKVRAQIPVTVTGIQYGSMTENLELNAISRFLDQSVIKSPAAAFVKQTHVNQGDYVSKGALLFILKTREASVLIEDTANPIAFSGLIRVLAGMDGVVTELIHPDGDFIQEGDELGIIAIPGSLVFMLQVPYENIGDVSVGKSCKIRLSNGKLADGRITAQLPSVSLKAQTQQFLITPSGMAGIPENLIATVIIPTTVHQRATILPKACVLTDEIMQHWWVMKLTDDTTAIKVPVKIGLTQGDLVEILDPAFQPADLFLASGNYGLGDTAYVRVISRTAHE